jgi:hypothetical protein
VKTDPDVPRLILDYFEISDKFGPPVFAMNEEELAELADRIRAIGETLWEESGAEREYLRNLYSKELAPDVLLIAFAFLDCHERNK